MPSYVVTGTSRGIGLAFVKELAENPENIVFGIVRSLGDARQLTDFVATLDHKNVHVIEADICNNKAVYKAAEAVKEVTDGKLDVLINNAALMQQERAWLTLDEFPNPDLLDEDMIAFFKANALGVIHMINAFLPLLRAGNMKKCINISTSVGSPPFIMKNDFTFAPGYGMSKEAAKSASAKYAAKFKNEGLIFISLSPGFVRTMIGPEDRAEAFYAATEKKMREKNPNSEGAITPEKSAREQLDFIHKATIEQTGGYFTRDGSVGQ